MNLSNNNITATENILLLLLLLLLPFMIILRVPRVYHQAYRVRSCHQSAA